MSKIEMYADPSGKNGETQVIMFVGGRQLGKQNFVRNFEIQQNIVMVDDLGETQKRDTGIIEKFHKQWIDHFFSKYAAVKQPIVERQIIRKGVKKRYIKVPRINKMLSAREYFDKAFKLEFKSQKNDMRTKKYPIRPTTKAESIFDAEKRLQREAKEIAQTFTHTKPIKYLLK